MAQHDHYNEKTRRAEQDGAVEFGHDEGCEGDEAAESPNVVIDGS